MRKSKFSEAQIVAIVRKSEAEGVTVENARLKKVVAQLTLDVDILKEINSKNGERTGSPRAGGLRRRLWG